jgi:hypothetical protein
MFHTIRKTSQFRSRGARVGARVGRLAAIAVGACAVTAAVPAGAAVYTAKNFTNWAGSSTNHTHVVTGRVGNGTWQLGRNFYTVYVTVGAPVNGNSGVPLTGTYLNLANAANNTAAHTLGPATINNGPLSSTTVGADSKITVTHAATPPNGIYNINMNLHAYSNHNLFRAVGVAKARGTDPLEIVTPGVFAQTLSLGPDSSVWVSPDAVATSRAGITSCARRA